MLIQNQLHLPNRAPISLGSIENPASVRALNNQPLSPTSVSFSGGSQKQSDVAQKNGGKQQSLKGIPNLVGLQSLEYKLDESITVSILELTQKDFQQSYLNQLYSQDNIEMVMSKLKNFQKLEVVITMPNEMLIEQVEIQIENFDLFSKYLKVFSIEKSDEEKLMYENEQEKILFIKGGLLDSQLKTIEMNTCGVSKQIKLLFLFDKNQKPSQKSSNFFQAQEAKDQLFQKTMNISDKIKNEILPLLNGSDDDIDELDDEVAMISNKKEPLSQSYPLHDLKDEINVDDIKIEVKGKAAKNSQLNTENFQKQQDQEDPEITRSFNTMPRNYSESQQNKKVQKQGESLPPSAQQSTQALEIEIFSHKNLLQKLLSKVIKQIRVTGFNCNSISAITNITHFMNQSFLLKKEKHISDSVEIDFFTGVLMISTKRPTQAVEVFRKIQIFYLKKIDAFQSKIHLEEASRKVENKNPTTKIYMQETNKLLMKCAILELLSVESMSSSNQVNEKLLALRRMVDLSQGKTVSQLMFSPQIPLSEDPYSALIKLLPYILKFTLLALSHKKEIVKMAACKLLEFVLETKGCSLDSAMVFILKQILKSYPGQVSHASKSQEHPNSVQATPLSSCPSEYFNQPTNMAIQDVNHTSPQSCQEQPFSQKDPQSGFSQALKNVYSHLLDTYISVLSSISSHILHQLFYEVIVPTITTSISPPPAAIAKQPGFGEIKTFSIKIAEKIITICQGDLILSKQSLDYFLQQSCVNSKQQDSQASQQLQLATKTLWQSIRQKVFTNYSQKGLRILIDWLVDKMSLIAQNGQLEVQTLSKNNGNGTNILNDTQSDIAKLEINEEESIQLGQLFEIMTIISSGRKKNEEEANSLIKIKQEYCLELYLLINPLLFWLDFSVEREERLPLFKNIYQTLKDVLDNLPPKRVDLDLLQIMIPILQRTTEFLKNNSPGLSMLKFLDIVLRDIRQGGFCQINPDLQYFFLDMLSNLVTYMSYCLYEEIFAVFDKLLVLCTDVLNEKALTKCIVALVDKYTLKNKAHKASLAAFSKSLLEVKVSQHKRATITNGEHRKGNNTFSNNNNLETEELGEEDDDQLSIHSKNNYFEIVVDFCFISNSEEPAPGSNQTPNDAQDLYLDKLQFFIDTISQLTELHQPLFSQMIAQPKFKHLLLALLAKPQTQIRLKAHEMLEVLGQYYVQYCTQKTVYELAVAGSGQSKKSEVMEVEFINHERLYLSQIALQCVKASLEQKNDSYLQFNSLILLDFLFQNLLPVPTYQNEQLRDRVQKSKSSNNQIQSTQGNGGLAKGDTVLDLETMEINETTLQFEVTKKQYINMRLNIVFKLWPFIQQALNSAWSNIRSICYGLICSMLKIDIRDYAPSSSNVQTQQQQLFHQKLKQIVLPMLMNLLSSKESESKAGGLNILGSFCGLSYDFSKVKISKNLEFFKKNSQFISLSIWQQVFDLQDDWDITIKEASVVLIQLCAPRDAIKYFDKVKREKEHHKFGNMINKYGMGQMGSSRQSSTNNFYLNSHNSNNENDDYSQNINHQQLMGKIDANITKSNNILSFLSGADDMSMVMQLDQQIQTQYGDMIFGDPSSNMKLLSNSRSNQRALNGSNASDDINILNMGLPTNAKDKKQLLDFDQDALINYPNFQIDGSTPLDNIDQEGDEQAFQFFVDDYSDEQIQEIISIFRNDFKPPKNLWIEKNPTSVYNAPDYYQDIFSAAIDQFNQQQAQLQQLQQQQLQQQVSGSPKSSSSKLLMDVMEDDLVKKCEQEKKEKELKLQQKNGGEHMIFERHFEDSNEILEQNNAVIVEQDALSLGNIDAEPYKFLDSPSSTSSTEEVKKENVVQPEPFEIGIKQEPVVEKQVKKKCDKPLVPNLSLQIVDDTETTFKKRPQIQNINQNGQKWTSYGSQKQKQSEDIDQNDIENDVDEKRKKTTDDLIEEYERKINKTKQLLEEEKKKTFNTSQTIKGTKVQSDELQSNIEGLPKSSADPSNAKSTPEFKTKQLNQQVQQTQNEQQPSQQQQFKQVKKQAQTYLTELSKGYMNNVDNMKLIKQINNCFNDNSFNNFNIGPVVMPGTVTSTKHKQKLNKSFENLLAANKANMKGNTGNKKNLSTSPKRGSSSGKKNSHKLNSSQLLNSKKKYLDQSTRSGGSNQNGSKVMYNMRDLNFFIKTIEKDLSDKFSKLNIKDFNSMPTTPTSILKKVEDQVKAMASQPSHHNAQNKDAKAYMSNTCPNMAQILGSLDTSSSQKSSNVLQISNIQNNASQKISDMLQSSTCTPVSNIYSGGGGMQQQSQNSLSGIQNLSCIGGNNNFDKQFSFSKTQKIDFKDSNKNMFSYQARDNQTHRDTSNENHPLKKNKSPQNKEEKISYANLLKSKAEKGYSSKRSRGSQEKYLIGGVGQAGPASTSQSKLNKSLNNISNSGQTKHLKKEQLSKSMLANASKSNNHHPHIGSSKGGNLSPHASKRQVQQMIKQQLQATQNYHSGHQTNQLLYEYISNQQQQQQQNKIGLNAKTPIKVSVKGGKVNYSEILEVSPSSADKEYNRFRQIL